MDKKDKSILYELTKNSRISYSQLAKKTGLSQESIRYRTKKLEEKTIQRYRTIMNIKLLGLSLYQIFLKLQNVREQDKLQIIKMLDSNKNVAWVANFEGAYDLGFIVVVKDQIELQKVMDNLYIKFNNKIMDKTVSLLLEGNFFPRDYLVEEKRIANEVASYNYVDEGIKLDEKDRDICQELSNKSNESLVDIGSKIGLSADAVAVRLRNLNKKFITGYTIDLNHSEIGQIHYKILLKLNNLSKERVEELVKFISKNVRVTAIVKTLASWDYEIDLEVENPSQLKQFTMELTTQFSNIIKNYDTLQVTAMPKYSFYLPSFN